MQTGYKCYLKVTERTIIQFLICRELKLTTLSRTRRRTLAKICRKIENLFPDDFDF